MSEAGPGRSGLKRNKQKHPERFKLDPEAAKIKDGSSDLSEVWSKRKKGRWRKKETPLKTRRVLRS